MIHAQKRLSGRSSSSHLASRSPRVHHAWQEDQWQSDEATFTMIARNKKVFKPTWRNVFKRYYQKFSKAGKLEWEEQTLGLETIEEAAEDDQ